MFSPPPYHPCSNGAAERAVQLCKDRLKKMNVSAQPMELYVALAYICKVHGLTPHSSTGRCPYELIKKGNLPSLFPNLTTDVTKQSELTVTRQSTAKLRNRRIFDEGDKVVVYDEFRKFSYPAVVSEILGNNNYLVMSDNGPKHVSGDVLSRDAAEPATAPVDTVDENPVIDDDTISVLSDISEDFDEIYALPNAGGVNNDIQNVRNHCRRGQREIAGLGPAPLPMPRLRSGRILREA